ncbi:hypothetical protein OG897_09150 [Streptomyces sp. NBC_00237]|uniref:hypothetical protein n=1 Tax=Streptomyces sp. NBC_00237 TaxID=2975687 RepID=UPI002251969D|nr:hypothetical protein [Streptomyces sp. NBC_00237]MCX5201615.1 hypothetical protein [Streptomyces sp. NBC_00237]
MGGLRHIRTGSTTCRFRRGVALLCAATALLGALLTCLSPGSRASTGGPDTWRTPHHATAVPYATAPAYNCPYDRGGCGVFPHLSPAVLTAPPQDSAPGTALLAVRYAKNGEVPRTGRDGEVRARAPGKHALGVLRR